MPGTEDHWPWPNVRGKRCLGVGAGSLGLGTELSRRGAADVEECESLAGLRPTDDPFDIVVAVDVLGDLRDPGAGAGALASVSRGMLLSVEPIDLEHSVLGRGTPWIVGQLDGCAFNGAGHKQLLIDAGFAIERVARPYTCGFQRPTNGRRWGERVQSVARRAVTGSWAAGQLHRGLLARRTVR